jgi:F-type H+-transporting ATPase subunit beta
MATQFTGVPGSTVPLDETVAAFTGITEGKYDHISEQAFFNIGGLEDLEKNWARIQKELG